MDVILAKGFQSEKAGGAEGSGANVSPGVRLSIRHTGLIVVFYGFAAMLSLAVLVVEVAVAWLARRKGRKAKPWAIGLEHGRKEGVPSV